MRSSTVALVLATMAGCFADAFTVPAMFRRQGQNNAQLTLGKSFTPLSTIDGAQFVGDGLRDLCGSNGCDAGTPFVSDVTSGQFETFGDIIGCTWTVTASGNYDNTDQRDYMIALLTTSLTNTAELETITVSIEDNSLCTHQGQPSCTNVDEDITSALNFQQVVLNLDSGANTAELSYNLAVECRSGNDFDCGSFVSDNLKDALSAVPEVGAVIAEVFDIACA
jgi:hypothetical protein